MVPTSALAIMGLIPAAMSRAMGSETQHPFVAGLSSAARRSCLCCRSCMEGAWEEGLKIDAEPGLFTLA